MGEGCNNSRPFPSYSGAYRLETVQYNGSDAEFPFAAAPPDTITVTQDILHSGSWDNASIVINDAITGLYIMDGALDGSGNLTDRTNRTGRAIMETYSMSDTSSAFLGVGIGYACSFVFGASLHARVLSPLPRLLLASYPSCVDEVTSRGTLCVMPRSRSDLPVLADAWHAAGEPRISLKITAFKSQTHSPEFCTKVGAFAEMTMTYVRVASAAVENVDLRMNRAEATASGLTGLLDELKGAPDGAALLMGLPERAEDLRTLWPIEPGSGLDL
jgi:hypothetical protein